MKFLVTIFSIYLIFLISYPCQDIENANISNSTEQSSHHDNDCHDCSPFCFCNCCHISTIVTLKTILHKANIIPTIFISIFKISSVKEVILSIWEPPKIN